MKGKELKDGRELRSPTQRLGYSVKEPKTSSPGGIRAFPIRGSEPGNGGRDEKGGGKMFGEMGKLTQEERHVPASFPQSVRLLTDQWVSQFQTGVASPESLTESIQSLINRQKSSQTQSNLHSSLQKKPTFLRKTSSLGKDGMERMVLQPMKEGKQALSLNTSFQHFVLDSQLKKSTKNTPRKSQGSHVPKRTEKKAGKLAEMKEICFCSLFTDAQSYFHSVEPLIPSALKDYVLIQKSKKLFSTLEFASQILNSDSTPEAKSDDFQKANTDLFIESLQTELNKERKRSEAFQHSLQSLQIRTQTSLDRDKLTLTAFIKSATEFMQMKLKEIDQKLRNSEARFSSLIQFAGKIIHQNHLRYDHSLASSIQENRPNLVKTKDFLRMKTFETLYYKAQKNVLRLQKTVFEVKTNAKNAVLLENMFLKLRSEASNVGHMLDVREKTLEEAERLRMRINDLEGKFWTVFDEIEIRGKCLEAKLVDRTEEYERKERDLEVAERLRMRLHDLEGQFLTVSGEIEMRGKCRETKVVDRTEEYERKMRDLETEIRDLKENEESELKQKIQFYEDQCAGLTLQMVQDASKHEVSLAEKDLEIQRLTDLAAGVLSNQTEDRCRMMIEDLFSITFRSAQTFLPFQTIIKDLKSRIDDLEAENSYLGNENSFLNKECDDLKIGMGTLDLGKSLNGDTLEQLKETIIELQERWTVALKLETQLRVENDCLEKEKTVLQNRLTMALEDQIHLFETTELLDWLRTRLRTMQETEEGTNKLKEHAFDLRKMSENLFNQLREKDLELKRIEEKRVLAEQEIEFMQINVRSI